MKDVVPYIVAQLIGAAGAAGCVLFLKDSPSVTPMTPDIARALVAEFIFTFALCFVILNVATARGTSGNSYFGLAIAFTVVAGAFAVGSVSGAVFNPAVAVGITLLGLSAPANIWIYFAANFGGGVAAALAFKAINPTDK